jgi:ABC-2 type transport system permease protein
MSVLFLFFTVSFAARSLLAEKEGGTLARVLATPTRPGALAIGKTLAVSALALAGFVTVWVVTSVGFDGDWGNPLGVVLVMIATVAALAGVATFIASLAETERQADAFTSIVTFAFALIGGNFVRPGQNPAALETLALFTPNGWSLQAFTDLSADAATVASVLGSIGVLLGFALLFGTIGVVRARRVVSV